MVVCNCCSLIGHFETDHMLFARGNTTSSFIRFQAATKPIIMDAVYFLHLLLLAHLIKPFRRTETGIGGTFVNENSGIMLITFATLRLAIGTIFTAMNRALIRRET